MSPKFKRAVSTWSQKSSLTTRPLTIADFNEATESDDEVLTAMYATKTLQKKEVAFSFRVSPDSSPPKYEKHRPIRVIESLPIDECADVNRSKCPQIDFAFSLEDIMQCVDILS
jgi:hypothetical protein